MKLAEFISILDRPEVQGSLDCEVTGLTYDSRTTVPGMIFVAIRGLQQDGHQYVEQAMARGAAAAVVEKKRSYGPSQTRSCVIQVKDTRKALSALAHQFYGRPSHRMGLIGVTGTNGKTTTTYLIKGILEAAGKKVGLLGTVNYHVGQEVLPPSHTTPESLDLHRLLARMVEAGIEYTVMEVSSHALVLERVADCAFDVGIFTNLTQDHLDFHGSLDNYFEAKLKLFVNLGEKNPKLFPRRALVNWEDPRADRVIASTQVPCWTYGYGRQADLSTENLQMAFEGIRFFAQTPKGKFEIHSALTGRYNVSNILAAIGTALSQDIPIPVIQKGIKETHQIPGRFEKIQEGQNFLVVVDYAHTEDALQKLLLAVRELRVARSAGGRILTVLGCGGDRDRGKRPKMGRVATELSDLVILTSDNPRMEDPMDIIREIEAGIQQGPDSRGQQAEYLIIPNRSEAIEKTIRFARERDIVVIAGKGHENYQIIEDRKLHFDDREVARGILRRL